MFAAHSISDYQYSDSRDEICEIPNLIRFFLSAIVNTLNSLIKLTGTGVLCKNISLQEQSVGIIGCSGNRFILSVRKDIFSTLRKSEKH